MPTLPSLLAQTASIANTFEVVKASPYTPWVVGAVLVFLAFSLLKAATKFIIHGIGVFLALTMGFLAWNWWHESSDRSLQDIRSEWFDVIRHTDFSKESIQGLMARSSDLLNEALEVSQAKGGEGTEEALGAVSQALDSKIREAAAQGHTEARERFEQLRAEVRRRLAELDRPEA